MLKIEVELPADLTSEGVPYGSYVSFFPLTCTFQSFHLVNLNNIWMYITVDRLKGIDRSGSLEWAG